MLDIIIYNTFFFFRNKIWMQFFCLIRMIRNFDLEKVPDFLTQKLLLYMALRKNYYINLSPEAIIKQLSRSGKIYMDNHDSPAD